MLRHGSRVAPSRRPETMCDLQYWGSLSTGDTSCISADPQYWGSLSARDTSCIPVRTPVRPRAPQDNADLLGNKTAFRSCTNRSFNSFFEK